MSDDTASKIKGQASTRKERKKRIIRIGRKEVILGGLILTGAFVVGAVAWQFSKYWLLDRRYEKMADKAVEAIKATGEVVEKLDDAGYSAASTIGQLKN